MIDVQLYRPQISSRSCVKKIGTSHMFVILTVTDRKVSDERHKMASPARREYPERPLVGVGAVILSDAGVVLIKRGKPPRVGA